MPTNFDAAAYRAGLQTLLDRHEVEITVKAFRPEREYAKLQTPIAELMIEEFPCEWNGQLRSLDGVLTAGLLVMVKLSDDEAEERAFELALDVATALVDEVELAEDPEDLTAAQTPVFGAGSIMVTGIEPESPEGALQHRVASYLVRFEQAWRIARANAIEEPDPYTTLYAGRSPNVGEDHIDDYTRLVPPEE